MADGGVFHLERLPIPSEKICRVSDVNRLVANPALIITTRLVGDAGSQNMDRSIFGTIRAIKQHVEMYPFRDVVLVGTAGAATVMAFVFFIMQTISAVAGSY